ncbi:hypothetical protein SAMN05216251_13072 [Actinacidiphila alni]|uniref:Secreted protein n=1 Tax=Actinacidiphila alni TaxID=380248 RepID=A0A1I2LWR1_9ACTN|nr:hypothetical protein [Actinacidiphila alni]SFF81927.1 hypothetical protein SAMN05216251_13072 [Actinacidiphila alni]
MKRTRLRLATVGAAFALAIGLVGTTAGSASANVAVGKLELCAWGNYQIYATMPNGTTTQIVSPGPCRTFDVPNTHSWEPIQLYGLYRTFYGTFKVGLPMFYNADQMGLGMGAHGTTDTGNNSYEVWVTSAS